MIALAAWLIISTSFFLSQPNQNEEVNLHDSNSPIAKFWHEYGWQYKSQVLRSVYFANYQQGWAVGNNGTILATQDGGKNWEKQVSHTVQTLKSVHLANDQRVWVTGSGGTTLTSQNGGSIWYEQVSNTTEDLESMHYVNDQQGWAVGEGIILTTQDGGKNWLAARFVETRLPNWYSLFSILCAVVFFLGLLGIRAPTRSDAISTMLSSDRPRRGNESDALESRKLAWALSRFLRHQRTEPPLTLAINAPRGGGKSSLMNWLREDLERFEFRPVWFNAWHYEKQEQMFPALLETIRQQAVPSSWLSWSNVKFRRRLLWHRIKIHPWLTGLLFILICFPIGYLYTNYDKTWASIRTQAVWSLEQAFPRHSASTPANTIDTITDNTIVSILPPKPRNKPDKEREIKEHEVSVVQKKESISDALTLLLSLFPGLAPLIGLWKGLQSFSTAGNWLSRWLNPTEQSKASMETAYRAQFARDFHAVTSALDHTLIIFIDDLDRCQPESVCEVMETVNFLASEGSCYIVLRIWREGVERAIGLGFAEAAKEFSQISSLQIKNENPSEIKIKSGIVNQDEAEIRRRYGQLYLEKLINIWVSVPTLEITAAQNMLKREHNPPQQLSNLTITTGRVKSLLYSALKDWRDQLWNSLKQSYETICQLPAIETWRNLRWANQISLLWRFLIRLMGICVLGLFFLFGYVTVNC